MFSAARSLLLVLLLSVAAGEARAQPEPLPLVTGFVPDPLVRIGSTGGARALRELAPGCAGFVGEEPSHVFELRTRFPFLRMFVVAAQPVSIAIRAPDGRITCAQQRRAGDRPPRIEDRFAPGTYEVWVASHRASQEIAYELHVTEFRTWTVDRGRAEARVTASGRSIGLDEAAAEGQHCGRWLRRGFLPDPRQDVGTTGGSVDVASLGVRCEGYVASTPSHLLTLRDEFDYFRVQIGDAAGATLVVRTPGGEYLCSSPADANPFVEREAWAAGDYTIWVGTREPSTEQRYRICYTEVRSSAGAAACQQSDAARMAPREACNRGRPPREAGTSDAD